MSHTVSTQAAQTATTAQKAEWTPVRRALVIAGALFIAATWLYFVLVHPADWDQVLSLIHI